MLGYQFFCLFHYEMNNKYMMDSYHLLKCNILTIDYHSTNPSPYLAPTSLINSIKAHNLIDHLER